MPEFHQVTTDDNQPVFQFYHKGIEMCIWMWLGTEGNSGKTYQMNLSEVVYDGKGGYKPKTLMVMHTYLQVIPDAGGVRAFMRNEFLPKVNEYLATVSGVDEPDVSDYPTDGNDRDKFNWIITNALRYEDGKVNFPE